MRRADREVTELSELVRIMEQCDVCRLALNDGDYPYILPLNFGMEVRDGTVTLYFHSALEGRKLDLLRQDSRASFEMDCGHELVMERERGHCTMLYKSVIGRGHVELVPEEDRDRGLAILMEHYHPGEAFPYSKKAIPRTMVYKLTVEQMTGKVKQK